MTEATEKLWSEFSLVNEANPAQKHRWRIVVGEARRHLPHRATPLILDLGCGSGTLLAHVQEAFADARLMGIDIEPRALSIARARMPEAIFHHGDLETGRCSEVEALAGQIDAILCSEVLEHLGHPENALHLAARSLKSDGILIVTVPSGSMTRFDRSIGHHRHYSLAGFERFLQENGFRVLRSYRWGFPFHSLFRLGMQLLPAATDRFSNERLSAPKRALLALLDALFMLNIRSRHAGRQIVVVAQRARS